MWPSSLVEALYRAAISAFLALVFTGMAFLAGVISGGAVLFATIGAFALMLVIDTVALFFPGKK